MLRKARKGVGLMTFPEMLAIQNEGHMGYSEPVQRAARWRDGAPTPMGQTQGSAAVAGSSPDRAKWFGSGLGGEADFSYCGGRMAHVEGLPNQKPMVP